MKISKGPANSGNKKTDEPRKVTEVIYVQNFIEDENGKTIGVKGLSYPGRIEYNVVMSSEGAKADNKERPDFAAYRKGFKTGMMRDDDEGIKMDVGAVLRLSGFKKEDGRFEADWINFIAKNEEERKKGVSFAYAAAELWPSKETRELRNKIAEKIGAEQPELKGRQLNAAIEKELRSELKGQQRYENANVLLYHHEHIADLTASDARDWFAKYYAEERFARVVGKEEDGKEYSYDKVSPGLLIRAVNGEGEVLGCVKLGSTAYFKEKADTPEQRADLAAMYMREIQTPETASFSVLPFDSVKVGLKGLKVNNNNEHLLNRLQNLLALTRVNKKDENGSWYVQECAAPCAVRFSQPSGMVSDAVLATESYSRRVEVALLARDGTEMKEAAAVAAEEEDSPSPGM